MARYTKAKSRLLATKTLDLKDGVPVHIAASLAAGTVATTVCAPADVLKSRLQSAVSVKGRRSVRVESPWGRVHIEESSLTQV